MPVNFNPYANNGYVSFIKEVEAGVAITPTNNIRVIKQTLNANYKSQDINEMAQTRERRQTSVQGQVEMGGEIEFNADHETMGHFLRSVFGAPVTQTLTASTSFRHTFSVGTPKTYCVDVQVADRPWVHRFFGLYFTKFTLERNDNVIKCIAETMAQKAFTQTRVKTSVGSGTALHVGQTSGLTTADTILIIDKDDGFTTKATLTIAAVVDENNLTVSTIGVTIDVNDLVVIKRATITSYINKSPFTYFGGTQIYVGADVDNTSEEAKEDLSLEIGNDVEARYLSGLDDIDRFPGEILIKGFLADGKVTKYYDSESYLDRKTANSEFGFRALFQNEVAIHANSAVKARTYYGTGNGFYVECATAGKAGNDMNLTIVINDTDDLAASISGNNILLELANTTASKNTGTLIAALLNALTGVDAAAEGTGATQFTAAVDNNNLGDSISGATAAVVGRDASEKPYMQFDFAAARVGEFDVTGSEDEIVTQEIPLMFYNDSDATDQQRKKYTAKVRIVNAISAY